MPRDNTTSEKIRDTFGKAWNKIRETIGKPSVHDVDKEIPTSTVGVRGSIDEEQDDEAHV